MSQSARARLAHCGEIDVLQVISLYLDADSSFFFALEDQFFVKDRVTFVKKQSGETSKPAVSVGHTYTYKAR